MNGTGNVLPPPLDRTTTRCPHALVHLVRLTRQPNLVNLERRETVRRDFKVDLKCTRRSWNFRPEKEMVRLHQATTAAEAYLEVQEPRSTQLPDECIFGMSQRSVSIEDQACARMVR